MVCYSLSYHEDTEIPEDVQLGRCWLLCCCSEATELRAKEGESSLGMIQENGNPRLQGVLEEAREPGQANTEAEGGLLRKEWFKGGGS